ncbi:transposase [Azospirillum thermophilum]|uniref:Transposase n=1 Tax=Azospirillum thermophilum TaxID=2202148 RepID=A0A2S2CXP6_9PROT|nr:transposase [Azospirillum thermophilum]AWK89292.1 hypothetical protein DEW08_24120 [Azospirillum thermophilum]
MEVITGDVGRRTWSPEEKERILAEGAVPGAVVPEVARRHGLRPQQVFGWRREARAANRLQEEGLGVRAGGAGHHAAPSRTEGAPGHRGADRRCGGARAGRHGRRHRQGGAARGEGVAVRASR